MSQYVPRQSYHSPATMFAKSESHAADSENEVKGRSQASQQLSSKEQEEGRWDQVQFLHEVL